MTRNQKGIVCLLPATTAAPWGSFPLPKSLEKCPRHGDVPFPGVFSGMVPAEVGSTKLTGNLNQSENRMAIGYVSAEPALLQAGQTQLPWGQKNSGTVNHKLDPSGVWETFSPSGAVTPWCKSASRSDEDFLLLRKGFTKLKARVNIIVTLQPHVIGILP